jgi:hypothetical protein
MTASAQERLLKEAVDEALRDPTFGRALRRALDESVPKRPRRRTHPAIDPFTTYQQGGEAALREALGALSADQLKDVVAHHQMDRAKLAMRWQARERLVDLIVGQTMSRAHKGEAFLR